MSSVSFLKLSLLSHARAKVNSRYRQPRYFQPEVLDRTHCAHEVPLLLLSDTNDMQHSSRFTYSHIFFEVTIYHIYIIYISYYGIEMAWGGSNLLTVFALARVDPIPLPSNTVLAPKSCRCELLQPVSRCLGLYQ